MAAEFQTVLREFRLQAGLTQEDLAERSGVSRHAISMLESGKRCPRLSSVNRLAAGLGLDQTGRELLIASARVAHADAVAPGVGGTLTALTAESEELAGQIEWAQRLSPDVIDTFMAQTELLRTLDRQMGPASLVEQTHAHVTALENFLALTMRPSTREQVAWALAGAATFAASQARDLGAAKNAWRLAELGRRAAVEANDPRYLAYAMARQATVLSTVGRPELAVLLVEEAQRTVGSKASPRQTAWLHVAAAKSFAYAGQRDAALRALNRADALLPPGDDSRDPDMPNIFLNHNDLVRHRSRILSHFGDDTALDALYDALARNDATFTRPTVALHCDLARAHLIRGERDQAVNHLRNARGLANRAGLARHLARIDQLTATL
ncbi:helix-turn-helix transcriptional regulator [Kitasatospora sp. NPDC097643]|uniref:helix-turn-helix transcriptional regulator n=1 Tax=Kitasatospora sp. NPDC097643 TaxID=3157230 RepID=UPI00332036DE